MVIVDTTVWIDYLGGTVNTETEWLDREMPRQRIGLTDMIVCEVLQGIRDEKQFVAIKQHFENLIYLDADRSTFELGASIYRDLRRSGTTIRNSIDCLIAATVIQHGVNFLERDRDYKFIDEHFPLNRL